jgi:hypothetical protein
VVWVGDGAEGVRAWTAVRLMRMRVMLRLQARFLLVMARRRWACPRAAGARSTRGLRGAGRGALTAMPAISAATTFPCASTYASHIRGRLPSTGRGPRPASSPGSMKPLRTTVRRRSAHEHRKDESRTRTKRTRTPYLNAELDHGPLGPALFEFEWLVGYEKPEDESTDDAPAMKTLVKLDEAEDESTGEEDKPLLVMVVVGDDVTDEALGAMGPEGIPAEASAGVSKE